MIIKPIKADSSYFEEVIKACTVPPSRLDAIKFDNNQFVYKKLSF